MKPLTPKERDQVLEAAELIFSGRVFACNALNKVVTGDSQAGNLLTDKFIEFYEGARGEAWAELAEREYRIMWLLWFRELNGVL